MKIHSRKKTGFGVLFVRANCFSLLFAIACSVSLAQAVAPITPSGLNTVVSAPISLPSGQTQFNITGGTRPGGGTNLFHSFGNFNVPNNNIANFLNNCGLPTSNILGRVTGGNISRIFGTIQTTGFGNANLFLMNPAGFLFGPNATVNVGGMVSFSSADYLKLADGARFNAIPNASADALLSAAPVAAFGFLGSNPGAITVHGSQLTVAEGTGISMVGGNITVQGGTLTAPSGQVNLVSVGRPSNGHVGGEVVVAGAGPGTGFTPTGFRTLSNITLSQGSTIDVSATAGSTMDAGSVVIRGGQFVMNGSSVKAGVPFLDQSSGGTIDVTAKQVTLSNHSTLDASVGKFMAGCPIGCGHSTRAGRITFNVGTFSATDTAILATALESGAGGGALGGTVTIQGLQGSGTFARSVSLTSTEVATTSGSFGIAGPISMRADNIALNQSTLNASAGDNVGGHITLVSRGGLDIRNSSLLTTSVLVLGGPVVLTAGRNIDLMGTIINTQAINGGSITMAAPTISLSSSTLTTFGAFSEFVNSGTISLTATKAVKLSNGTVLSVIVTQDQAGFIRINGGALFTSQQSTISSAGGLLGGTIQIKAKTINLTNTQLTTSRSDSNAGTITVDAKSTALTNSLILSNAVNGHGGTITITSPSFHQHASVIDASSQFGTNGTVTINGVVQP